MSTTSARLLARWTAGRYSCTLVATGTPPRLSVAWAPERPASLTAAEHREFRRRRDTAIDRAARALGMRPRDVAALLDADPDQPRTDRAAGPTDERGHWNADR